jgi:hypothetical protein
MIRRGSIFWGIILALAGILLLLVNLNILPQSFWAYFGPLLLIILGIWILFGRRKRWKQWKGSEQDHHGEIIDQISLPLEGAARASLEINHAAGKLNVYALDQTDLLLVGDFGGGAEKSLKRSGDMANVRISAPSGDFLPFFDSGGYNWDFGLNREVPLQLVFKMGANDARMDLSQLKVTDLSIDTGASSVNVTLPAAVQLIRVRVKAGAAAVNLRLPEGVAARIKVNSGLTGVNIDRGRFPQSGSTYQSDNYDSAVCKADITLDTGVGSIDIH